MSTMTETDTRDQMRAALRDLMERATSTDPDDALTFETPLSLEVSGKYVNVLFSTGGPHTELLAEYWDAESAEQWYDSEPAGAWFTRKDWGSREDVYVSALDAGLIMQAITRDPDEMQEVDADTDE